MTKRKSLNPVIIVLNRNFNEVLESMVFALVLKSDDSISMKTYTNVQSILSTIKNSEFSENVEASVYVKMPFTKTFINGKSIITAAMKKYFPEVKETICLTETVDEVQTETIEVIEVTEVAPKKRKTTKKKVNKKD